MFLYLPGDSKFAFSTGRITDAREERGGYDGRDRRGGSWVDSELSTPSVASSPTTLPLPSDSRVRKLVFLAE